MIFHTTQHDVLAQGHVFLYVQSYDSSLAHDVILQGLSRWSPASFNINLTTSDYIHETGLKTRHACLRHASSQSSFISTLIYQDAQAVCWWVCEGFPAAEDLTDRQSPEPITTRKDERTARLTSCLLFGVLQGCINSSSFC